MTQDRKVPPCLPDSEVPETRAFRQGVVTSGDAPLSGDAASGLIRGLTRRRVALIAGLAPFLPSVGLARPKTHGSPTLHHPATGAGAGPLHAPAVLRNAPPPRPLVMLDPGHGGKDPGAIGYSGTYEKHVAEAAATELERQLMASGRYRVAMTRTSDRFIPLEGRVEMAQAHRAELFISMHADALHDASVRGASVYTLSSAASDSQTALIAQSENSADLFGGPHVHATSPEVQQILASLVSEETRRGSAHIASSVVASFQSRLTLLSHPQRHAAFVVLKAADIPSVLVEMGFMSNRHDEESLRQAGHRAMVAGAMRDAVDRYFASARVGMG
ncbi:N-acetylmuramoyl-L-alanine amidase family protein [Acetobacter fallax]|uniref:N-acetylmuramoyl-L-alanine amidase n=1 Tax=Acetobacter fallax TaxID=1737473 RepID=A0ABX0KC77_9PROT|nr:N-acetylmuramoyl-L-alanine amidase [Acetobacter fallax]NHO33590.1 N-acetylmuramoyl-L-alanine amidase [Acetobacter fallax]NHO37164.1 N-acetylmuramoyl-L-alanine amidase [Acetobacter fallax]